MKFISALVIFVLIGVSVKAQDRYNRTEMDTIETYPTKILVEYRTYSDSTIIEKTDAFLYPKVLEIPKFKFLQNVFKTRFLVDSIVFHGERVTYLKQSIL